MNTHFSLGNVNAKVYFLVVSSCLGLVFALLNRDGSDLTLLQLLIIWQAQTIGPISMVILAHIQLLKFKIAHSLNTWLQLATSGFLGSILFTPFGLAIDLHWAGEPLPLDVANELLDEFSGFAPPVIFVWIAINAPWVLGYRVWHISEQVNSPNSTNSLSSSKAMASEGSHDLKPASQHEIRLSDPGSPALKHFYALLPDDFGEEMIYLKAELHYLKVVKPGGARH